MTTPPDRLGLALAGGGFRAALFHLGVLHRLAELDLLRSVEVISTVSGGSVIGATYILRLKHWLERNAQLTRDDYIAIVQEVDAALCDGIDRNLRTRLLLNPVTTLRVMLTEHSLARAMARLYERNIFARAMAGLEDLHPVTRGRFEGSAGAMLLDDLLVRAHSTEMAGGIDAYNAAQVENGGSVITRLVVNATTLNSGGRFAFSAVEIGDWYLGQFRRDEISPLLERRRLLRDVDDEELDRIVAGDDDSGLTTSSDPRAVASLVQWWRDRDDDDAVERVPTGWEPLYERLATGRFPGALADAELGALRRAKLPAWYLRHGRDYSPPITGGRTREQHWRRILAALGDIDAELARTIRTRLAADDDTRATFLDYLIEIYLVRTADRASPALEDDWQRLTVGDAVGASACFPPVFPPFSLTGIYDDAHVTRLGLTDGGVYDNTGIAALLDEGCTSIIASDTGGVFRMMSAAPRGHVPMTLRIPDILMRAVGEFQRFGLRERRRVSRDVEAVTGVLPATSDCDDARDALLQLYADRELRDLAYFHMETPPPEPTEPPAPLHLPLDRRRLSRLRTDLDTFGEVERAALINHGYDTADRFVRRFMTGYARTEWAERVPVAPKPMVGGARVEKVIDAGASRFLRALHVRAPVTVTVMVLATVALLLGAVRGVSLADLWEGVGSGAGAVIAFVDSVIGVVFGPVAGVVRGLLAFIPDIAVPWIGGRLQDPMTIPVVVGVVGVGFVLRWVRGKGRVVWLRTARKWGTGYFWNVLWLVWALPVIIVAVVTAVAAAGWVLFYLPWRERARVRASDVAASREVGGEAG